MSPHHTRPACGRVNRFSRRRQRCPVRSARRRSTGYHVADARRVHRRRVRAVGQDRRPGRRRRRPRARARAVAGRRRSTGRSTSSCRATARCRSRRTRPSRPGVRACRRPDVGRRAPATSSIVDVAARRLSAAARRPSGRIRSRRPLRRRGERLPGQRLAVRAALPGGPRDDARPRRARSTSSMSTTGRPAPALLTATRATRTIPSGADRDPAHDPQPRLPRLDAAPPTSGSSGFDPATASCRAMPTASTSCAGDRGARTSSTRSAPALRARR